MMSGIQFSIDIQLLCLIACSLCYGIFVSSACSITDRCLLLSVS